jgi:hypothetical protein
MIPPILVCLSSHLTRPESAMDFGLFIHGERV